MSDSVVPPLLLIMQYAAAEYCAIKRKRERRSGVIPIDSVLIRVVSRGRTRAKVMVLKEQHRLMISVVKRVNFAIYVDDKKRGEEIGRLWGRKGRPTKGSLGVGVLKEAKSSKRGVFFFFFFDQKQSFQTVTPQEPFSSTDQIKSFLSLIEPP